MSKEDRRKRFFSAFVDLALGRPGLVAAVTAVLLITGIVLAATGLKIKTSRYEMVRKDEPYQMRMDRFFDRFGYPDAFVLVVQGGDEDGRRRTVDAIVAELEHEPEYRNRVLGRITADDVAELMLLQQPDALQQVRALVGPEADAAAMIEGGLSGILGAIEAQLDAVVEGEGEGQVDKADEGLARLGTMARLLDHRLQGQDVSEELFSLMDEERGKTEDGEDPLQDMEGIDDRGYLVSRSGEYLLVAAFPRMATSEVDSYGPAVELLRKVRDDVTAEVAAEGVEVELTGLPVLVVDEHHLVSRGLWQSGLATGLGVFLVLALAYRSMRQTVFALLPLGIGMGISMILIVTLIGSLNPVTSAMFAILLGLGIDFAVHLMGRFHESLEDSEDMDEALRQGVIKAGPGVFTGAITTALAFLSVLSADFTAFAELGGMTAIGLVCVLFSTFLLLPLLVGRTGYRAFAPPRLPLIHRLPSMTRRGGLPVLIIGGLIGLGGLGLAAAGQVTYNSRYLDFIPQKIESSKALDTLERAGLFSPLLAYVSADGIDQARERAAALREMEDVGIVQSPSDLLPPLGDGRLEALRKGLADVGRDPDFDKLVGRERSAAALSAQVKSIIDLLDEVAFMLEGAGRETKSVDAAKAEFAALKTTLDGLPEDGKPVLDEVEGQLADLLGRGWATARTVADRGSYLPSDLPPLFQVRFRELDPEGDGVALFVFPEDRIWEGGRAARFAAEVEKVDPNAAGHAISMHVHGKMVLRDFKRAAALAGILVILVLALDFRRVGDTLLALVPLLVGFGWMFGLMVATGVEINLANIVVLPLILGIGIDSGVHMLHRARESAEVHGGVGRLEELVEGTGAQVLLSSITTMVGFAGLMIPDHGVMVTLGKVMVIGTGCCLLASLLVLPPLLYLLKKVE